MCYCFSHLIGLFSVIYKFTWVFSFSVSLRQLLCHCNIFFTPFRFLLQRSMNVILDRALTVAPVSMKINHRLATTLDLTEKMKTPSSASVPLVLLARYAKQVCRVGLSRARN